MKFGIIEENPEEPEKIETIRKNSIESERETTRESKHSARIHKNAGESK